MFFKIKIFLFIVFLSISAQGKDGYPDGGTNTSTKAKKDNTKKYVQQYPVVEGQIRHIEVIGQGVAPSFAHSPAQAYILAKRAAIADAYRLIAEKVKGVKINGHDTIENMMVKGSVTEAKVSAMVKNAVITETNYKDLLCEVKMEIDVNLQNF